MTEIPLPALLKACDYHTHTNRAAAEAMGGREPTLDDILPDHKPFMLLVITAECRGLVVSLAPGVETKDDRIIQTLIDNFESSPAVRRRRK